MAALAKSLDRLQPADAASAGPKAFNCARLKQSGFAVPDGIVLTTAAMGGSLDIPELQDWLAHLPPGTLLAVRSSAVDEDGVAHSFAGIHETRLNVRPADVPEAVKACWQSVASPAAIAYRRMQRLPIDDVKTAVLIQRMIQPRVSGVAFTVHPVTGRKDELLINSAPGIGEALVSGQVQPDEFVLAKGDGRLRESHVAGDQPTLNQPQLRELAGLLLDIERQFGAPQDVEWCLDDAGFWFVQTRPVTAAAAAVKRDLEWTRANAREVFPDLPPPMTVYSAAAVIDRAQRRFYGKLLGPEEEFGPVAKAFYGRMYFNIDQMRYVSRLTSTAPASILRSLGHEGEISPEDQVAQKPRAVELFRALPSMARLLFRHAIAGYTVRKQLASAAHHVRRFEAMNFHELSDAELWAENARSSEEFERKLGLVFVLAGVSIYENALREICRRVGLPYERLAHPVVAAGEKSVSGRQAFDLLRLVRTAREEGGGIDGPKFRAEFEHFLKLYGHRGHYESDFSAPRYIEDPSPILAAVKAHLEDPVSPDPDEIAERQNAEAGQAVLEFESKLTAFQRLTVLPRARWLLKRIKTFYLWRERVRSEYMRVGLPIRKLHLTLADRFVQRGWIRSQADYFYLTLEDVGDVIGGRTSGPALREIADRRKVEWERLRTIEMPLLMRESQLPALVRRNVPVPANDASELFGLCVSPGLVEGEVVVLHDPGEIPQMKRGAILVTVATDPSWTPLFTLASGIVVEVGGMLSHASTVAREYGLPALANVKHATKILKNGDRVRLDATNGVLRRLGSGRRTERE